MPESRASEVLGVTWAFLILSTVATVLRIYCRGWVMKAFAVDDWLAVAAQILFIVFCSYEIVGVGYGTGRHFRDISNEHYPRAMEMWWTCEPLYVLTNMTIKASIAIFLLRICVQWYHRWIIYVVTAITEVYSLFFFLLFILQCRPTNLFWLRFTDNPPAGSCLEASIVPNCFYGYSAISCWTDWTFSILPAVLVWNLQMDRKVKISVIAVLAAGAIASTATIVRFPYLHSLTDVQDFLYTTADVAIWSTIETGLGITASGLATLRPLLKAVFGGSSVPAYDNSARHWHRTSSGHPIGGYVRSNSTKTNERFELQDGNGKGIGVTTIINYGLDGDEDANGRKVKTDNGSDLSASVPDTGDWNNSQSDLTSGNQTSQSNQAWNIRVKKTIVQTREEEV